MFVPSGTLGLILFLFPLAVLFLKFFIQVPVFTLFETSSQVEMVQWNIE